MVTWLPVRHVERLQGVVAALFPIRVRMDDRLNVQGDQDWSHPRTSYGVVYAVYPACYSSCCWSEQLFCTEVKGILVCFEAFPGV